MFVLSKSDRDILQQVVRWWRKRVENAGRGGGADQRDHEEFPAPEVYAAKTVLPIPARDGTTPGTEMADIYAISLTNGNAELPTLVPVTPLNQRVYNLSSQEIPAERYPIVWRDKFGRWLTMGTGEENDEPGTGTQSYSSCESIAKIKTTDCVVVRTGLKNYYLRHDGSGWTSAETFDWGTGSGVFRFEWNADTGLADLLLGGLRLLNCGAGCYSGGPLTGHGSNLDNSCNGVAFTVCVECHCCPDPMWNGDAWYCVKTGVGVGTGADQCEPLFVTEALACSVEICSGPYPSYEAAAAVCGQGTCDPGPFQLTMTGWVDDAAWMNDTWAAGYGGYDFDVAQLPVLQGPVIDLTCTDGVYSLEIKDTDKTNISSLCDPEDITVVGTITNSSPLTIQFSIPGCWGPTSNAINTGIVGVVTIP